MNEQQSIHQSGPPPRKIQLAEVCVFLFLIVPSMILSAPVVQKGTLNFSFVATISILQDLALLSLILFFVWRNAEGLRALGLKAENWRRELLLGVLLYVPFAFFVRWLAHFLQWAGVSLPEKPPMFLIPQGAAQTALAVVFLIVVALTEEVLFRGYLLLRFRQLLKSTPTAVILSAVIFSLGHGYQGVAGIIVVGAMGVVFALIYLWRQSLLAVMMIHFLQDFMAMIIGPVVLGK
jgi:membrane protease YdiL (CAAX protease family)